VFAHDDKTMQAFLPKSKSGTRLAALDTAFAAGTQHNRSHCLQTITLLKSTSRPATLIADNLSASGCSQKQPSATTRQLLLLWLPWLPPG
jgi:hypothetical protein